MSKKAPKGSGVVALEQVVASESGTGARVLFVFDPVTDIIDSLILEGGEAGLSFEAILPGGVPFDATVQAGETQTIPVQNLRRSDIVRATTSSPPVT